MKCNKPPGTESGLIADDARDLWNLLLHRAFDAQSQSHVAGRTTDARPHQADMHEPCAVYIEEFHIATVRLQRRAHQVKRLRHPRHQALLGLRR